MNFEKEFRKVSEYEVTLVIFDDMSDFNLKQNIPCFAS